MSRGSNNRCRAFFSPSGREQLRGLRLQLVRQAGCVQSECRDMARELLADTEWMAEEGRNLVRIPRSFREPLACLEKASPPTRRSPTLRKW